MDVYGSVGVEKHDESGVFLGNHAKIDGFRSFSNKKFYNSHVVHRQLMKDEDYSKPSKEKNRQVSGILGRFQYLLLSVEAWLHI